VKFLAVSQDNELAKSVCIEFKQQGYEVFAATSLKEAGELCSKEKPEVIVADHMQSDGNFFDFYDALKVSIGKETPPVAIILTEPNSTITPEVAIAMGGWAVFTKPFQIKSLFYSVEDAVFSRKQGYTKRLDERIDLTSRLNIKFPESPRVISTFSTNISFGGFFAALTNDIPSVGEEVEFRLMFSSQEAIDGKGKVAWVRKEAKVGVQMGCGVQFSEGREKYVQFLVPIINETRTRQIELASFKIEDVNDILNQSVRAAKEKISKTVTEIYLLPQDEKIPILCRSPQMLSVFSLLIYEIVHPMRDIKGSNCMIAIKTKSKKIVDIIFTCIPSGASLFVETLIEEKIQPILDMHKAKIQCEFNSISSTVVVSLERA
jgi:DNA-binding response OmpR family regulator